MNIVFITGAASGIGLALTTVCLQKKFTVIMVDKDEEKLHETVLQLSKQFPKQILSKICDVTQVAAVNALAQELSQEVPHIHWIFNNAGIIGHLSPIWDLTAEQVHQVLSVNLYGMIHIIQAFIPLLFKQNIPSHIINIASLYALCSGAQLAPYSMSKHAVLALSESLFFDLKRLEKPIDVSVVFPSFTDTALLSTPTTHSTFHDSLSSLLAHSRPALEVAHHIIQEVEQKRFYIFPDKEVKGYCEERVNAMVAQEEPHINNIEKLITSLIKRNDRNKKGN